MRIVINTILMNKIKKLQPAKNTQLVKIVSNNLLIYYIIIYIYKIVIMTKIAFT